MLAQAINTRRHINIGNYNFVGTKTVITNWLLYPHPLRTHELGGGWNPDIVSYVFNSRGYAGQVSLCFACKIGGRELWTQFGGGLPNIAVSTLFYSTPPGLRPYSYGEPRLRVPAIADIHCSLTREHFVVPLFFATQKAEEDLHLRPPTTKNGRPLQDGRCLWEV